MIECFLFIIPTWVSSLFNLHLFLRAAYRIFGPDAPVPSRFLVHVLGLVKVKICQRVFCEFRLNFRPFHCERLLWRIIYKNDDISKITFDISPSKIKIASPNTCENDYKLLRRRIFPEINEDIYYLVLKQKKIIQIEFKKHMLCGHMAFTYNLFFLIIIPVFQLQIN